MRVHKEGYNIIAVAFIIASAVVLGCYYLLGWGVFTQIICFAALVIFAFVVRFFRVPKRTHVVDKDLVVAPCDGKVVLIQEVEENEYLKEKCLQVSIFMSVFNVHVNRMPTKGTIVKKAYVPGKFLNASLDKASKDNERCNFLIEAPCGARYGVTQIAGLVAKRIVPFVKEGDKLERAERFGLIRFGSRLDVYLPKGVKPNVRLGQIMVAGETVLGCLA